MREYGREDNEIERLVLIWELVLRGFVCPPKVILLVIDVGYLETKLGYSEEIFSWHHAIAFGITSDPSYSPPLR